MIKARKKPRKRPVRIVPISQVRFDALAGYARSPNIVLIIVELEGYATEDERLLGVVTLDRTDNDFGWVIFGRDEGLRFRAIDVNVSHLSIEDARAELIAKLEEQWARPDESFHQGDVTGPPTDFFTPVVRAERLHPIFKSLIDGPQYSPARGIIEPMMRFYEDPDGNFVEQFQTTAFDARLWELYLFAVFVELGYARIPGFNAPDFVLRSPFGALSVEATTINPPANNAPKMPENQEQAAAYLENYVPIKLARTLRRKLNKKSPYWNIPALEDVPFVLAVQDFHSPGSMRVFTQAATEYAFGVRHSMQDGKHVVDRIDEHVWGNLRERSGFFDQPGAENVSALVINPTGTLSKFNRMGYVAGFGDRKIKIIVRGLARGERDESDPRPRFFAHKVWEPGYSESWVEGMVVLHNPRAKVPLPPELIPGASHEFLQEDGRIMSLLPNFHPYISQTVILAPDPAKPKRRRTRRK